MATLTVDDKTAREIYPTAPPALKAVLDKSFPPDFFVEDITSLIISFEAACEYNNTNPHSPRFIYGTRNQIYQERVAEIIKAVNQGWIADYDNNSQEKWAPYFWLNSPGFRFGGSRCGVTGSLASGGSRFALKSRKLANFMGQHFLEEYKNWLMPSSEEAFMNQSIIVSANRDFKGDMADWEAYIIPRTGSFEAACQEAGVSPTDPRFGFGTPDEIAYRKGKLFCDVLNAPFMDKMKDTTSRKWWAWMEKTDTGFRFLGSFFGVSGSRASGGSRLRLCSEKLAKHFGVTLVETMALYWWNE